MKSYDRFVVWLDYLDSERKRADGRRVPLNSCVRAPTLEELSEACRRLKLDPQPQQAGFPRSGGRVSGYVSVKKGGPKQSTMIAIARELSSARGKRAAHPGKV